jgi:hypothetical protein
MDMIYRTGFRPIGNLGSAQTKPLGFLRKYPVEEIAGMLAEHLGSDAKELADVCRYVMGSGSAPPGFGRYSSSMTGLAASV